jgi:hypothetical protein
MHSRNIKAREPRPAANLAAATSNIEKRGGKMDAIVEIGKMIGDVISQIKGAIAADKQVCYHLLVVHEPKVHPSLLTQKIT